MATEAIEQREEPVENQNKISWDEYDLIIQDALKENPGTCPDCGE